MPRAAASIARPNKVRPVPELDFAVTCDYVRAEGVGVAHVIGGGFDTIHAAEVPTGRNMGLWGRILLARNECGRPHRLEVIFQDEDGERLTELTGPVTGEWPGEDFPLAWKVGVAFAFNLGVPLPRYGLYSFDLMLNDSLVKTIPLRVVPIDGTPDG
jgi:hypothetical protein